MASEKLKQTAMQEVEHVKELTREGLESRAYLYPVKGLLYFASRPPLWGPLMRQLLPTIGLSAAVTALMFTFTYLPQAAVLTLFNGPLAAISTIFLVLSESATISIGLGKAWFIGGALLDTFDATLMAENMTSLVSTGREIKSGEDPMARLGKAVRKPFNSFTPQALLRRLLYLPLNFIPVIGTGLYIVLQGKKAGPEFHSRYYQLKEMSERQKEEFVEKRKAAYTSFGVAAILFELIPVFGLFFSFTNTVGAALWASDLEKYGTTAPSLKEQVKKVE